MGNDFGSEILQIAATELLLLLLGLFEYVIGLGLLFEKLEESRPQDD